MCSLTQSFLKEFDKEKIVMVGFACDENSSYLRGAAAAPPMIREALYNEAANLWSETEVDLGHTDTYFDAGDFHFNSPQEALTGIESTVSSLLKNDVPVISLGGDHSITFPIIQAFHKKYPKITILQLDAHPDLYYNYKENPLSNASPFARIMENQLADRLIQMGVRTMNGHQRQQADKYKVTVIEMKDFQGPTNLNLDSPLYISIDIDVLDPAFAPGVSHHEPGGMTTRQVLDIIHTLEGANIVGADIVEFNPRRDLNGVTAMTAAKILKELSAKILETKS